MSFCLTFDRILRIQISFGLAWTQFLRVLNRFVLIWIHLFKSEQIRNLFFVSFATSGTSFRLMLSWCLVGTRICTSHSTFRWLGTLMLMQFNCIVRFEKSLVSVTYFLSRVFFNCKTTRVLTRFVKDILVQKKILNLYKHKTYLFFRPNIWTSYLQELCNNLLFAKFRVCQESRKQAF